ncbi:SDR family oxidoreductase [Nonomuraea diastatica]|uniref:SDR family oxidoreductase n=1 Tax=Nonomuraea diastatica TaxID=1848329 RepID=A0A4R4X348_9ACTN|nr:SDR family oxidoreductase [Nonomuraea diastatica]TDD24605.1 SDR family oxidoreductase [Nonomuraea diastatica]
MLDTKLRDQVVLVTGASGGIGAAIARAFSAEGARVAVHYVTETPAPPGVEWEHAAFTPDTATKLAMELGNAVAAHGDLREPSTARHLFDEVEHRLGPVGVLVNNAAHCESPDAFGALDGAGLRRHYEVNAIAPALLISELAKRQPQGSTSCVVNITTDAARAFPGQIGYGTSKAALEALTRAAALDLAPVGIRVNAVAPGPVQTGWMDAETYEHARSIVPMGRVGEPADIADAVVFLASHQARWITGQVLQVAGGHAL